MFKETTITNESKKFGLPVVEVRTHRLIKSYEEDRWSGRNLQPEHVFTCYEAGNKAIHVFEANIDIKDTYGKDWPVRKPLITLFVEQDFVVVHPWFGCSFTVTGNSLPEIVGQAMNFFNVWVTEKGDSRNTWSNIVSDED